MSSSEEYSRLKDDVKNDISDQEMRFYRKLDDVSSRIGSLMKKNNMSPKELSKKLDCDLHRVKRMLDGGLNYSMKIITKLEIIFDENIINIENSYEK